MLEWPERTIWVVLCELSEHGALVETTERMEMDIEVQFSRNELRGPARVAWRNGRLAGIAFGRPLKADLVFRHIKKPVVRAVDDEIFRGPRFNRVGMMKEQATASG